MSIWPFRRKRRAAQDGTAPAPAPPPPPLSEKAQPPAANRAFTDPTSTSSRPLSSAGSQRKRRASSQQDNADEGTKKRQAAAGKENVGPRRVGSIENITALPMSQPLEHSPHLRPADVERPAIPYSFRPYNDSRTSVHAAAAAAAATDDHHRLTSSSRPNTLRSKRSVHDGGGGGGSFHRQQSNRRRKEDRVREEEIRAMSDPVPVPRRPAAPGDSPLRRDSVRVKGVGKDSSISIPPEGSIHSTMSGIVEQRGWEIGVLDVFNPRPAVRLSGVPQYVPQGSLPETSLLSRELSKREEKRPATKDTTRKRQTVGTGADDLDASDLRAIMERDSKRRERKKKEQQDKLDRKLRNRNGRNRGDSDKSQKRRAAEEAKRRVEQESATMISPFRDPSAVDIDAVGLGIDEEKKADREPEQETTRGETQAAAASGDPFADNVIESGIAREGVAREDEDPSAEQSMNRMDEAPGEGAVFGTAQAVQMSPVPTPPASPIQSRPSQSISQVTQKDVLVDQPPPPPARNPRRISDPNRDTTRRPGAWATIFRRGTTATKKPTEGASTPSEFSFSNTSRESMRKQPLPAHLVDTQATNTEIRRRSGPPQRTMSRFREDLPESDTQISPPDSSLPSPVLSGPAAGTLAARRTSRVIQSPDAPSVTTSTIPEDEINEPPSPGPLDGPLTPNTHRRRLMSASMASVDSEGSWLASGAGKRTSAQSGIERGLGSLSRRRQEQEETRESRDSEYFQTMTPGVDTQRPLQARNPGSPALTGAGQDEASELDDAVRPETPGDPLTVHESVRRQPTLVHRNTRVKSREGLLTEYSRAASPEEGSPGNDNEGEEEEGEGEEEAGEGSKLATYRMNDSTADTADADDDEDEDEGESPPEQAVQEVKRATSVSYGSGDRGHARQISAGSAKLYDVSRSNTRAASEQDPASVPGSPTMGHF